jgi:hypothetical protein
MLGVAIQRPNNEFNFEPASMDEKIKTAVRIIGLPVAFSMASGITSSLFSQISPYQTEIIIQPRGTRIPVIASLDNLPARSFEIRQALVCLVMKEKIAVVWANNLESAFPRGSDVEHMLMETVWLPHHIFSACHLTNILQIWGSSFGMPRAFSRAATVTKSLQFSTPAERPQTPQTPRTLQMTPDVGKNEKNEKSSIYINSTDISDEEEEEDFDPEAAKTGFMKRPMILTHSVMVGLTLILLITVESLVVAKVRN